MNFYNYMLIIQQEAMKAIIKKSINIGYQIDEVNKVVFLADPTGQCCFRIPKSLFVLDVSKLKEMTSLVDMYHSAMANGHSISVTDEMLILQRGKSTQYRKLYDSENNLEIWINNKFLGYFKGNKKVMYNYFDYKGGRIVFAYSFENNACEVLGIAVQQKPKR